MASTLYIKKGGRFRTDGELRGVVQQIMGPRIHRAGLIREGTLKEATPVGAVRGGTLRGNWYTTVPAWKGTRFISYNGNPTVYARWVDRTSKLNAGYIKRGADNGTPRAVTELQAGVREMIPHLWESR